MPPKRKLLTGFKSEAEAQRQLILATSLERGEVTIPAYEEAARVKPEVADVLFADHINDYLSRIVNKGSSRAMKDKVRALGLLEEKLGHFKLGELTKRNLQSFLDEFADTVYKSGDNGVKHYYSQTYIDKLYNNTNCCIRDAREIGLMVGNPMEFVKNPDSRKTYEDEDAKALADEEIRVILAALEKKPMLHTLVLVMLHTGIRPGEAFGLKFSDFNFADKTLSIKRAVSVEAEIDLATKRTSNSKMVIKELKNERKGKKNHVARRVIEVSNEVLAAVRLLWDAIHADAQQVAKREAIGHQEFLFTAPRDGELKRPDYYIQEYGKELERHGLDSSEYNMYRTRHTFCTWCFTKLKLSPKQVAYLMGDSSTDMVMRVYQSVSKEDTLENSGKFSEHMGKVIAGVAVIDSE